MRTIQVIDNPTDSIVLLYSIHVGSIYEAPHEYGISHLLEHMMFQSKKSKTSKKLLQGMADAGSLYNASTSFDMTLYYMIGQKDVWRDVVDLFWTLTFDGLDFTEAELANEVDVVLEELSMRTQTGLDEAITKFMWKNTSYDHDIGGNRESLKGIRKADLLAFHAKYYGDSHLFVNAPASVRKEVDAYVKERFAAYLSTSPACPDPPRYDILKIKAQENMVMISPDPKVETNTVLLLFRSFPYDHQKVTLIDLFTHALTGLAGILSQDLRSANGMTYSISAGNVSYVDHGFYEIAFQSTHKDVVKTLRSFFESLESASTAFSRKGFQGLKRSFMLSKATSMRDPFAASMELMHFKFYSGIDVDSLDAYMKLVEATLDYDAFVKFVHEILDIQGALLFVSTFETHEANLIKVAGAFKAFLKAVGGGSTPPPQPRA